ncbi:MAG: hypothetical protein HC840_24360, partial [Leptolyngbyaceae cyanobacterium RM2_2_4]|nr:hypothetical protein [Leptolyngbyaceae cyanobacterium RM2_2_4]
MSDQPTSENCWQITTPVCLLIFKRPEATRRVLDVIRQVRPPELFVVADGSRVSISEEAEQCLAARAVVKEVDWECQIFENYSDINLGCRQRVSSGLNWVFENVEEAIILEDDCLPDISFFRFCEELLARYRHDDRVIAISGDNFQFGNKRTEHSYYFSRHPHCWGWATWQRAWQNFDGEMRCWPELRDSQWLHRIFNGDELAVEYWTKVFQRNYDGFDSWAYAWTFSCWLHDGLTVIPSLNLVSNIGFDDAGTNTRKREHLLSCLPTEHLRFPLSHPPELIRHIDADTFTEKTVFSGSRPRQASEPLVSRNTSQSVKIIALKRKVAHKLSSVYQKLRLAITIKPVLKPALLLIESEDYQRAFAYLNQIKAEKQSVKHLDRLRAVCFLNLGQKGSAIQALREELRHFPRNRSARKLLKSLNQKVNQSHLANVSDPEFPELLKLVQPHTMLSEARLYSLFSLTKRTCVDNIPGDIVECGVAGGGSALLIALTIKRYTQNPRFLYACDSFEGMPEPTEKDRYRSNNAASTGWGTGTCSASVNYIQRLFSEFGVEDITIFTKGYFQDTLPDLQLRSGTIALLHADGDWYESTRTIFDNLYARISSGGFIQVDDYGYWEGCREAIHDFEMRRNLKFDIKTIDSTGIWFSKSEPSGNYCSNPTYLNLGCGGCFHLGWTNVDFKAKSQGIIAHDLLQGIPFPDACFSVVYHSIYSS